METQTGREWYKNGLNDFHIYVKQALLDHSEPQCQVKFAGQQSQRA